MSAEVLRHEGGEWHTKVAMVATNLCHFEL